MVSFHTGQELIWKYEGIAKELPQERHADGIPRIFPGVEKVAVENPHPSVHHPDVFLIPTLAYS